MFRPLWLANILHMPEEAPPLRRELGLRDLVLFNIAALISTRWVAVAAHTGPGSLYLWAVAAVFFLVPCALVVGHLSRQFPEQGGLCIWTRHAFGEWHSFVCGWFYYLNNLFWIPGVLIASIGMISYAFGPQVAKLAENPRYVLPTALLLLGGIIAVNYVGLRVAKWVDNFGGIAVYGIWIVLVAAAIVSLWTKPAATQFELVPHFEFNKLNFWSQMAFAMTGLELSPIMSGEIRDPRRIVARATWISAFLVALFYILGTAAILVFLTPAVVSPVTGLAQTGSHVALQLGWHWVPLFIALAIVLSVGGQLGTYVGACARIPFVLGIGKMLPPAFGKLHPRWRTPYISILLLGAGAALLLVLSQVGETFRAAYQFSVDMSVITLFIPFLYMFASAWKFGHRVAAVSGFFVSLIAIVFSFLPTDDVRSVWLFEAKLIGGCLLMLLLARLCYLRYRSVAQ